MSRPIQSIEIPDSVPDRIAVSWHRSSACGLQRTSRKELPYSADGLDDRPLVRAAQPVLDRLGQALSGAPASLMLADENGCIVDQRIGDVQTLHKALRISGAAPGVWFTEEFAGTNGIGTTLEDASVTTVHGDQHFVEYMQHLSCVGAPIRHPITSALRGVLDLTTLVGDYNPLMAPLVLEAVKHIETRLTHFSSAHEIALMEEFRRASTKCHGPVVAIAANIFLSNTAATGVIQPYDHTVLWEFATSKTTTGEFVATIQLGAGPCMVTCTPVTPTLGKERGYVMRLDYIAAPGGARRRSAAATASAVDLPGRSALWRRAVDELRRQVNKPEPVVIFGEEGLGKITLARQVQSIGSERGKTHVVESSDYVADEIIRTLTQGRGVILRCTGPTPAGELSDLVSRAAMCADSDKRAGRLIVTVRVPDALDGELERSLTGTACSVHLPPVRRRPEDLTDIVPALLGSQPGGRGLRCSSSAMQMLMKNRWPDNVAGLERALRSASAAVRGGEIQPGDLPDWLVKESGGRSLSTYERVERELIIETLRDVGNNRTQAARILGIGRATLYRKMRTFGIPISGRHT
ncbi:sigma-54-dependent Fis family transcriptional regulator [Nocardia mikamii]|uniref:sigma-54-dependent Fis family transcriptional regulator n=1 Tax=Nocardia mikamii TaxID=508464 RepID=UPI0007A42F69|nr:helix-turn-helix domain-containing protein [Nocardia mikamii]